MLYFKVIKQNLWSTVIHLVYLRKSAKAVAENFMLEKKLIQHELHQRGILSLLVTPDELNVQLINKYLDIKSRNSI